MTVQLRGVLTALATPFAADGSVDEARLRALVDRSIEEERTGSWRAAPPASSPR